MKLTFLGTRGNIDTATDRHRLHTSLLVAYRGREVMIDCGADWAGRVDDVGPRAIVVTHSHPDHVGGLEGGAPCPVWATDDAWAGMEGLKPEDQRRHRVRPREPFEVEGIGFEAFPVLHSLRAPAVGYRVGAGRVAIFYVPDVVHIPERSEALAGVRLYIGDGATVDRNMVRRSDDGIFGHQTVRTQLTWCRDEGVGRMIVTHCGRQIVEGERDDPEGLREKLQGYADERGVEVEVATDGMELTLR